MILGYYYHIPICQNNGRLYVPGYLGIFLDALASEVQVLYLFMHEGNQQQIAEADYELQQSNIIFISLGNISPAWHRHLFHKKILSKASPVAEICDAIIIRAPTPLAPFFKNDLGKPRLIFMIVGDYLESANHFKIKNLRDWVMIQYLKRNDFLFRKVMRSADVLVNSPSLLNKYKHLGKTIHLIRTTTLTQHDFFERNDTCENNTIELLYTGRIEAAKGLFELLASLAQLRSLHLDVRLNIVGWEADSKKTIEKALLNKAIELRVEKYIIFHGRKKIGQALNDMYRKADIYLIPSYHEGFPRTIWEAMANSLPVITTCVGGIPDYLTNNENAILVEPKNITALVKKIILIIDNRDLRTKLIKNGYLLAKQNTIEIQTNSMINVIEKLLID
ncbi:MAG: hypothetical protein JWP81_4208 [Ferruginibacter sp.]|nr:hypothetical protein [Ferruginibacter sp.]